MREAFLRGTQGLSPRLFRALSGRALLRRRNEDFYLRQCGSRLCGTYGESMTNISRRLNRESGGPCRSLMSWLSGRSDRTPRLKKPNVFRMRIGTALPTRLRLLLFPTMLGTPNEGLPAWKCQERVFNSRAFKGGFSRRPLPERMSGFLNRFRPSVNVGEWATETWMSSKRKMPCALRSGGRSCSLSRRHSFPQFFPVFLRLRCCWRLAWRH